MPPMLIPVAHDFSCPWCWIGMLQAKQLAQEFGVTFDWLGYELYPEDMPFGDWTPKAQPPDRPKTPSRMQLAYAAQGIKKPENQGPAQIRTHKAHEAVEFAKLSGPVDDLIEAIYRAYYEQAADIDDLDTLIQIARPHVADIEGMTKAIQERRFQDRIVSFDEPAYESGVYNVPTFYIGGERYAEQPYVVLREAIQSALVTA